jgi:hypothetical protein
MILLGQLKNIASRAQTTQEKLQQSTDNIMDVY